MGTMTDLPPLTGPVTDRQHDVPTDQELGRKQCPLLAGEGISLERYCLDAVFNLDFGVVVNKRRDAFWFVPRVEIHRLVDSILPRCRGHIIPSFLSYRAARRKRLDFRVVCLLDSSMTRASSTFSIL
jgi:hypothetical protein